MSGLRLATPLLQDYAWIAARMRSDERAQFAALSGMPYTPDVCARALANTAGPHFALVDAAGYPVLLGGFEPQRPGVYEGWLAGTDEGWAQHWRAITLHCNRRLRALFLGGAHRVQLTALATRTGAIEWYERGLKMTCEGTRPGYCADGSDAVMYGRTA